MIRSSWLRRNGPLIGVLDYGRVQSRHLPDNLRFMLIRKFKANPWQDVMRKEGWIFIHIPKTAGTSLWRALGTKANWHPTLEEYFVFDSCSAEKCLKFTVVRNPWDRLVSAFHYSKFHHNTPQARSWRNYWLSDCNDFDSFISILKENTMFRKFILSHYLFRSQIDYITVSNDIGVDKWIRFENINSEIPSILNDIGRGKEHLERTNTSKRGAYTEYYKSQDVIDFVRELYREDVEAFGYEFHGP